MRQQRESVTDDDDDDDYIYIMSASSEGAYQIITDILKNLEIHLTWISLSFIAFHSI